MGRSGAATGRWGQRFAGADDGRDALRSLPVSDWLRLWANRRAKQLPESVAREIQLAITCFSLDVAAFFMLTGMVAAAVSLVTLVPLSTRLGQLWLALVLVEYTMLWFGIRYLQRCRGDGTLTASRFDRVLFIPTVLGAVFWGGLPAVVGTDSLDRFYLTLTVSALACSIGFFWTLGHWPASLLFAVIILGSVMTFYTVKSAGGGFTILMLGILLLVSLVGISAMAQIVLVRSYYFEAAARDREQTIGLLLDDYERGGQDFLWETDARLRFSHVPTQMAHAAHGDPRIATGSSLEALLRGHPSALAEIRANQPFNVRVAVVGPDGPGEIRLWGRPKSVQGMPLGYHGVGCDEEAVRRAAESERTTERLNAMVALTSGLAHDFNNQLATVLGAVELAALDPQVPESTLGYLNRAVDACLRTRRITADLVVASGYDASYQPAAFEIGSAVDDVADDLRTLFPDLEITVQREASAWVVADRDHYMRAVHNLMQNACQAVSAVANDSGTVDVRVHAIDSPDAERFACTDVTDTGPGVPSELTDQIFEPFSTTRRDRGGSGLGLSVARGFAHQCGGALTLEPTAQGASFRLLVPLDESAESAPDQGIAVETEGVAATAQLRGRFLVIEDDELVADNVAALLRTFGGVAEVAGSVAEAVEKFSGHTYDVECVISDLVLPDGEGYDVVAALRREHPGLRAIYMSGFTPTLPAHVAPELRCPFIAKPFSAVELAQALDAVGVAAGSSWSTSSY